MLTSLAFVPVFKVHEEFEKLKLHVLEEKNNKLNLLFDYFEKNFLYSYDFAEKWNAFIRIEKNIPLTTNNLESYHNAFKKFFSQAHPSFWLFIQCLNVWSKRFVY